MIELLERGSWVLPYSVRFPFGLGCLSLGGGSGQCGHSSPFSASHLPHRLPLLQFDSDGLNARHAVKKFEFRGLAVNIDGAGCSDTSATSAISSGEPACILGQRLNHAITMPHPRFSLRTLLVFVTVLAILSGIVAAIGNSYRESRLKLLREEKQRHIEVKAKRDELLQKMQEERAELQNTVDRARTLQQKTGNEP